MQKKLNQKLSKKSRDIFSFPPTPRSPQGKVMGGDDQCLVLHSMLILCGVVWWSRSEEYFLRVAVMGGIIPYLRHDGFGGRGECEGVNIPKMAANLETNAAPASKVAKGFPCYCNGRGVAIFWQYCFVIVMKKSVMLGLEIELCFIVVWRDLTLPHLGKYRTQCFVTKCTFTTTPSTKAVILLDQ